MGLRSQPRIRSPRSGPARTPHRPHRPHTPLALRASRASRDAATVLARFTAWKGDLPADGLAYVTSRRTTEELGLTAPEARSLLGTPGATVYPRRAAPLWRLA
ncbi:hypothetical protein [Streptomyces sp. H27-S2]|uniref:hypothetical protein n=1 Tax=Streptomyces antarcticus TaxID=2996458 RepID=UPI0022719BC3|nr:hypothetical protein [Streptomyces sp. H27-S2]MCY0949719.1 hypothetical protein [Streptomyces sp. H27-S2]